MKTDWTKCRGKKQRFDRERRRLQSRTGRAWAAPRSVSLVFILNSLSGRCFFSGIFFCSPTEGRVAWTALDTFERFPGKFWISGFLEPSSFFHPSHTTRPQTQSVVSCLAVLAVLAVRCGCSCPRLQPATSPEIHVLFTMPRAPCLSPLVRRACTRDLGPHTLKPGDG